MQTKTPPKGAVKSFQNHLAFKLGSALVCAKSPLKILKLPFSLGMIALSHKVYLDTLNTLYAQSPELKPEPLEIYSDYQEALKVKQTLSYKMGESMLKIRYYLFLRLLEFIVNLKRIAKFNLKDLKLWIATLVDARL